MAKLHIRLSVEVEVTDDQLIEIVEKAQHEYGLSETDFPFLPKEVQVKLQINNQLCDWDDGGYIPGEWLTYDAVDSGLYEADENGVRRKENAK